VLLLGASAAVVRAQVVDSVKDALADCVECLQTGGDGDCTDECDVIGNADDAVNKCCSWWSCSTCEDAATQATTKAADTTFATTRAPETKAPATNTPETKAPDTTTSSSSTKAPETAAPSTKPVVVYDTTSKGRNTETKRARTTTQTTTTSAFNPPVATVFESSDCTGRSVTLLVSDFKGGLDNTAWDACNAVWADGSAIQCVTSALARRGVVCFAALAGLWWWCFCGCCCCRRRRRRRCCFAQS
jgi:hypothetical protein